MERKITDPTQWRVDTLLSLGTDHIHEVARTAVASLTAFRLMLGRCLVALDENKGYKEFGCSGSVHYAQLRLKVSKRVARECRRVAKQLEPLPHLTLAAEYGRIEWSAVRAIASKASPETDKIWLKLAEDLHCNQIEKLAARTPAGGLPGDIFEDLERRTAELRCPFSDRSFQILEHVRRTVSVERGEAVNNADVLEHVLAFYMTHTSVDEETLEKIRREADKDLQAKEALREPLVQKAREVAERVVLADELAVQLAEQQQAKDPAELLAQAVGLRQDLMPQQGSARGCGCGHEHEREHGHERGCEHEHLFEKPHTCGAAPGHKHESTQSDNHPQEDKNRPSWVVSRKVPSGLALKDKPWHNKRLAFNHRARSLTKPQRRDMLRRDSWCCRTPGCPNMIWIHFHHIIEFRKGGKTSPENLIGLCTGCHKNVHDGYLKIEVLPNGEVLFLDSQGRRLDRAVNLEFAGWLDKWHGWRGGEDNSHRFREFNGEFVVVA